MNTSLLNMEPLTPGTCEWCGNDCHEKNVACSLSCEALLVRLEAVQGRIVLRALKRWRKHRGRKDTPGQGAMSEVASTVDGFLRTDRLRREDAGQKRRDVAAAAAAKKTAKDKKPVAVPESDPEG